MGNSSRRYCAKWGLILMLILPMSTNAQTIKTKKAKSSKFYESITLSGPVDNTTQINAMLRLFDLPGYNSVEYLESLRKQKILKRQAGKYWFRIALQEDFGSDTKCYMIFDSTLFWFGGFKLFAWDKTGENKREPQGIVWAEYEITPGKGFTMAISNLLDNTGLTHIDMKSWYGNLNGAHLSFDKRTKPKKLKEKK